MSKKKRKKKKKKRAPRRFVDRYGETCGNRRQRFKLSGRWRVVEATRDGSAGLMIGDKDDDCQALPKSSTHHPLQSMQMNALWHSLCSSLGSDGTVSYIKDFPYFSNCLTYIFIPKNAGPCMFLSSTRNRLPTRESSRKVP